MPNHESGTNYHHPQTQTVGTPQERDLKFLAKLKDGIELV
jgi:hypothetical protein